MKTLQVRNVPDDVHSRLKARAAMAGQSLSDFILAELRSVAERPSHAEFVARVRSRPPASVVESPEDVIRAEREDR
jgi:plasmid stability protein